MSDNIKRDDPKGQSVLSSILTNSIYGLITGTIIIYDVVTIPIYFIVQMPWRKWRMMWTVRSSPKPSGEPGTLDWTHDWDPPYPPSIYRNCETFADLFDVSIQKHSSQQCLGTRKVLDMVEGKSPDGKILKKKILDDHYDWITYAELDQKIDLIILGLTKTGVRPQDKVVLILETRMEWMLMSQALVRMGAVLCTMYNTLGEEGIIHGINELETKVIITNADVAEKTIHVQSRIPTVTTCIVVGSDQEAQSRRDQASEHDGNRIDILGLNEIMVQELDSEVMPPRPKGSDLALIMYTSGTTGVPKGVMFTQEQFVHSFLSIDSGFRYMGLSPNDTYLSYLPMAHIFEFLLQIVNISYGCRIGYSSPFTIFDSSVGLADGMKGDANVLKPTFMISVPLILDKMRTGIMATIGAKSLLFQKFFNFCISYKTFWATAGFNTPIMNRIIFKKIKALVGGNLRLMVVGAAPLSADTQLFMRAALDANLLQGFGTTETLASTCISDVFDHSVGFSGAPFHGVMIRLKEWPEGDYYPTDKPNPRGELLTGAKHISIGYYKRPEENKESFIDDPKEGIRWFVSGDIAEIDGKSGLIKIIDRKKDMIKLSNGEFVSLGKIESSLKRNPIIENLCIYGNSFKNHLVGVILPNRIQLMRIYDEIEKKVSKETSNGKVLNGDVNSNVLRKSFEEICSDKMVVKMVLKSIMKSGDEAGLRQIEVPKAILIVNDEWTASNGLVTASLKLRRKQVNEFYRDQIQGLYS